MRGTKILKSSFLLALCSIVLSSSLVQASDVMIPQSKLYNYRNSIELQDDFLSGAAGSGQVGALGWNIFQGTTVSQGSSGTNVGLYRRGTTAVSGTLTSTHLQGQTNALIDPSLPFRLLFRYRLNNNDANTTARAGALTSFAAVPPTDGIYIEKLDGDTNWFCVTRSGGTQTRVDSTVAVSTNFVVMSYTRNSSGVFFSLDNVQVCGAMTTNIPGAGLDPSIHIINSAAADKTLDIDYFEMVLSGLSR